MSSASPERQYSTPEIAQFLMEEEVAIHGLSTAVFAQNQALIGELQQAAKAAGPRILSVNLMGSRAHGASELTSDIDLCVLYAESHSGAVDEILLSCNAGPVMRSRELDFYAAAGAYDIRRAVPTDETEFINLVRDPRRSIIGLLHEGVYDTPGRRLLGLAALVIHSSESHPPDIAPFDWEAVRKNYAAAFLGEPLRVYDKVQERLRLSTIEVAEHLSFALMAARHKKFGLPTTMAELYERELTWLEASREELVRDPMFPFYERVVSLVR